VWFSYNLLDALLVGNRFILSNLFNTFHCNVQKISRENKKSCHFFVFSVTKSEYCNVATVTYIRIRFTRFRILDTHSYKPVIHDSALSLW